MDPGERIALVKILISHFADLHDIEVAHRDIGDHSVWLETGTVTDTSYSVKGKFHHEYGSNVCVGN